MSHKHFSEEELQRYALEDVIPDCSHCQQQIRAYQAVFNYIRDAEEPVVHISLPEILPDIKAEERRETRYLYCLLFVGVALVIAAVICCWQLIASVPAVTLTLGLLLLLAITAMELYHYLKKYTDEHIHGT
jgi:hypothetical protein